MAQEFKVYLPQCHCEVISANLTLVQTLAPEVANLVSLKLPIRKELDKLGLSYVRLQESSSGPELTLVSHPEVSLEARNRVRQITFQLKEKGTPVQSTREAEKWELAEERYRSTLKEHVEGVFKPGYRPAPGYGRNKDFDKNFTVKVRAPHWITLGVKNSTAQVDLLHSEGYSHVHPESGSLKDPPIAAPTAFTEFLASKGFSLEKRLQFYYWESAARRTSSKEDNGWIAIDLQSKQVAYYSASGGNGSVFPLENNRITIWVQGEKSPPPK